MFKDYGLGDVCRLNLKPATRYKMLLAFDVLKT